MDVSTPEGEHYVFIAPKKWKILENTAEGMLVQMVDEKSKTNINVTTTLPQFDFETELGPVHRP